MALWMKSAGAKAALAEASADPIDCASLVGHISASTAAAVEAVVLRALEELEKRLTKDIYNPSIC